MKLLSGISLSPVRGQLPRQPLSGEIFGVILLIALLLAPAAFICAAWINWRRRDAVPHWRKALMAASLSAASAAVVLLLVPFVLNVNANGRFARECPPFGIVLSFAALLLSLWGRGRVRLYSLVGASALCFLWLFLWHEAQIYY